MQHFTHKFVQFLERCIFSVLCINYFSGCGFYGSPVSQVSLGSPRSEPHGKLCLPYVVIVPVAGSKCVVGPMPYQLTVYLSLSIKLDYLLITSSNLAKPQKNSHEDQCLNNVYCINTIYNSNRYSCSQFSVCVTVIAEQKIFLVCLFGCLLNRFNGIRLQICSI